MDARRFISGLLSVFLAIVFVTWAIMMPEQGPILYVVGLVIFGWLLASCLEALFRQNPDTKMHAL